MDTDSIALITFALIALGAVFAFIFVFGGPQIDTTGQVSNYQKLGTSTYKELTADEACATGINCDDGLPGIPTGYYDEVRELYGCRCQTSNRAWNYQEPFYRSKYRFG